MCIKKNNLTSLVFFYFKKNTKFLCIFLLVWFSYLIAFTTDEKSFIGKEKKIITIGDNITEIIFALGRGDQVIAVDDTSFYPANVNSLPKVGYIRSLSAEGILSLAPNVILSSDEVKPVNVLTQLQNTGVRIELFSSKVDLNDSYKNIMRLSDFLGVPDQGEELVKKIQISISSIKRIIGENNLSSPKVLFVLSMGSGDPMVAGNNTRPNLVFNLVGARSPDNFLGWKNLIKEEVIRYNPNFVFYMDNAFRNENTKAMIEKHIGFINTDAIKKKQLYSLNYAYYFNLGPRLAESAYELAGLIHDKKLFSRKPSTVVNN